jgi:hypothetical protein
MHGIQCIDYNIHHKMHMIKCIEQVGLSRATLEISSYFPLWTFSHILYSIIFY